MEPSSKRQRSAECQDIGQLVGAESSAALFAEHTLQNRNYQKNRWFTGSTIFLNLLEGTGEETDDDNYSRCFAFDELIHKEELRSVLISSYGHDDELIQRSFGGVCCLFREIIIRNSSKL